MARLARPARWATYLGASGGKGEQGSWQASLHPQTTYTRIPSVPRRAKHAQQCNRWPTKRSEVTNGGNQLRVAPLAHCKLRLVPRRARASCSIAFGTRTFRVAPSRCARRGIARAVRVRGSGCSRELIDALDHVSPPLPFDVSCGLVAEAICVGELLRDGGSRCYEERNAVVHEHAGR